MADTLGTNTTGYAITGATYLRKGVPTIWDKAVWEVVYNQNILNPLIGGEGSNLPIIRKSDFTKTKGDTIRCYMEGIITGLGQSGRTLVREHEHVVKQYYQDAYINQKRIGILDDGEMSRQRDPYNINSRFARQLGRWYKEHMERNLFGTLYYGYPEHILSDAAIGGYALGSSGGPYPPKNWYCADQVNNPITYSATRATFVTNIKAAEAQLTDTSSDYFGPEVIEGASAFMKVNNFIPIDYKGFSGFICILHPYQVAQLRLHEKWFRAMEHAMPQGTDKNPIFTGGIASNLIGRWGNIIILESNYVHSGDYSYYTDLIATAAETGTGSAGSNVVEIDSNCANVYRALFLGAEAAVFCEAVKPHIERDNLIDYGDKNGAAVSGIWGAARAEFTSDDSDATLESHSVLVVSTYSPATPI